MSLSTETMLMTSILTTGFMITLFFFMYLSDKETKHAHILEFWIAYGAYFALSFVTQGKGPYIVALSTLGFIWRTRTIVLILSDVAGSSLVRKWHFYLVGGGYTLSLLLALVGTPFHVFTFPASISIFIVGIATTISCFRILRKEKLTPLHFLLLTIVALAYIHILDYPILRYNHEFTAYGFAFVLISTVTMAIILPGISIFELQKEKRRNLEQTLHERNTLLEGQSKMSSLGEMTASIVHEINNLVALIMGKSEQLKNMALRKELDQEAYIKGLDQVISITNRMNKIIQSLKLFSRDSSAETVRKVELKTVIEDTLAFCSDRFLEGQIPLMIGKIPNVFLECKSVQLSQVLLNLLNNAFEAVSDLNNKWVRIDFEVREKCVQILVIDSGKGIPKDLQAKIMRPFFTTKEVGKGTGLGLSISRSIIESHQGSFYIDTDAMNTTFVVELPYHQG